MDTHDQIYTKPSQYSYHYINLFQRYLFFRRKRTLSSGYVFPRIRFLVIPRCTPSIDNSVHDWWFCISNLFCIGVC